MSNSNEFEIHRMEQLKEILKNSKQEETVTKDNVYQPGNKKNRVLLDKLIQPFLMPGSRIENFQNLVDLFEYAKKGHSCLLLVEHYSNFDVPNLYYLLDKQGPKGHDITENLIAIAGVKLNEESTMVRACTEAYTRLVIYPSRSISAINDPEEKSRELRKSNEINRAAMRELHQLKKEGKLVLVFPAGTRYRPWKPETKKGIREIDSYLRLFEKMVFISINGNTLKICESENLLTDLVQDDIMVFNISPIYDCHEFRQKYREEAPAEADPKQYVVDKVMEQLENMHNKVEVYRKKELEQIEAQPK